MKLRTLLLASAIGFTLLGAGTLLAQSPPVVIGRGDLKGVPQEVKDLIKKFDGARDTYLITQRELLAQLKGATAEQRDGLRKELQVNRDALLADLKTFRTQLMDELKDLKGKITHQEFKRIIDAARDAATDGARHKGNR